MNIIVNTGRRVCRIRNGTARRRRRGATLVEAALTLGLSLALVFGALDLGLAVFRHHLLAYVAREIAREAIVHGSLADRLGSWGPTTLSGTADAPDEPDPDNPLHQVQAIAEPLLVGLPPGEVELLVEWPDGGNSPYDEDEVQVTVSTNFTPILTFVLGNPTFELSARSTMKIAH